MFIQRENALRTAVGAVRMNGKYGRYTRSAYEINGNMTGYRSKSRKAVRMTPRGNGKSGISVVKFLTEAVGKEKASEIIAEVKREMEKIIVEMDIGRDTADKDIADMEVQ